MAWIVEDSVLETTTTTGTGDITLAGALSAAWKAFSGVCAVGDKAFYSIEAVDGSGNRTGEWETGQGTYSAANTLTRSCIHRSSNANAAVSFSAGTKRVSIQATAGQLRGVRSATVAGAMMLGRVMR